MTRLCTCEWEDRPHSPVEDASAVEAFSRGWNLVVAVHYFHPETGELVIVSRKDDSTKFCTPGGKVDPCDWDGMEVTSNNAEWACRAAAAREAREEAGLIIDPAYVAEGLHRVMGTPCFGDGRLHKRFAVQYLVGRVKGVGMRTNEPITVRWGKPSEVVAGPFGDVYRMVYEALGVKV